MGALRARLGAGFLVMGVIAAPEAAASCEAVFWAGSGSYSDPSRWSVNPPYVANPDECTPGAGDEVYFASGGDVQFDDNQNMRANVQSAVTFDVSAGGYTLTGDPATLALFANGQLTDGAGLTVTGGGSVSTMGLAELNSIPLAINNGATLSAATADLLGSTVTISNGGTFIGGLLNSPSSLTLNGGTFTLGPGGNDLTLSQITATNSTVNLNDHELLIQNPTGPSSLNGTKFSAGILRNNGGALAVNNGSTIKADYSDAAGASVDISGKGTAFTATGPLGFGVLGSATVESQATLTASHLGVAGAFTLQNGAVATSSSATINGVNGNTGTANVGGLNASWTVNGALVVGSTPGGPGQLTVASGGAATVNNGSLDIGRRRTVRARSRSRGRPPVCPRRIPTLRSATPAEARSWWRSGRR